MATFFLILVYLLFFFSGAAALIYQVVWVRSLSLVFGGSHLAVTTVLAVFMGGLALGSYLFGRRYAHKTHLLRLYGLLELSIALSAVAFKGLMHVYPSIYVFLAQFAPDSRLFLSCIRVSFAVVALLVPTTLMGATLPILAGFFSGEGKKIGRHLSFLYGLNTLGAVVGTIAAGFLLLRYLGVSSTLFIAIFINVIIGVVSILLQGVFREGSEATASERKSDYRDEAIKINTGKELEQCAPVRLVLWGIGLSGFCALGYEILWTRILSMVIGASVYGFSIMLVAFLAGIAAGSSAYGLLLRFLDMRCWKEHGYPLSSSIFWFGVVQIIIGLVALLVTIQLRNLPGISVIGDGSSVSRIWASMILAFSYMFVPAFFMGVAFPLAGRVQVGYREKVGHAVGEVLAFNTLGAILGSVISGFILIYLVGIERSLQILILINISLGLTVIFNARKIKIWPIIPSGTFVLIIYLSFNSGVGRIWEVKKFATMLANNPKSVQSPIKEGELAKYTDVLYYGEGIQAIVSSIKTRGAYQSFITNGRPEASNSPSDMQCQYTLGHLPMLLHNNPRKVFVLGTGSGMTLGATSVHPTVEHIVLAEIEPKVLGVARTFADYNHNVLDNPKLEIIFNDGRNYLLTTNEKFDVITADPIHPWFSGAGYLYSDEYFRLAAEHLNPGGIITQWLPLYELTDKDLKSVVATFSKNFKYVMVWVTYYDAELVGSNEPIIIDEDELDKRINNPDIRKDLERVSMGSAKDLLNYFLMGNTGVSSYVGNGIINTDNNLYLEFSAPLSIGKTSLMGSNLGELLRYRESILPYLKRSVNIAYQEKQKVYWEKSLRASFKIAPVHVMTVAGQYSTAEYDSRLKNLVAEFPDDSRVRYLKDDYDQKKSTEPRLMQQMDLSLRGGEGRVVTVRFCAVISHLGKDLAFVDFVDNNSRQIFGQLAVVGEVKEAFIADKVNLIMNGVKEIYRNAQDTEKFSLPAASSVVPRIESYVSSMAKN